MGTDTTERSLAAMPGSPSAGSRWHLMHTKHGHVHCELRVCSFTPLVTGDSKGGLYVKYYAIGKKHEVECRCSVAEWGDLVKRGRIREANALHELPPPHASESCNRADGG